MSKHSRISKRSQAYKRTSV